MSLLWRPNNIFFWVRFRHIMSLFVFKFIVNCQVLKIIRQGAPYKAENWHALSHEQYFSKYRF